jgi:hypothetical protein
MSPDQRKQLPLTVQLLRVLAGATRKQGSAVEPQHQCRRNTNAAATPMPPQHQCRRNAA